MNGDIYKRIAVFCDRYQLFGQGDGVVVGLSGGADSVFLLLALCKLQKKWGLRLVAVHVNHGIRGEEARRDEEFAVAYAKCMGVHCYVERADIPGLAARWRMTEEEAGRTFRYQSFEKYREQLGFDKIAVAHHQDDQAETILLQLLRGSSLRGLGGMHPKRGCVIRPLLELGRAELEACLEQEKIAYCTDSTNKQDVYARNLLRNQVMPYLKEKLQPAAVQHIARTGMHLQEVMEYIDEQTEKVYQKLVRRERDKLCLSESAYRELSGVLQKELIFRLIAELAGRKKDITSVHIEAVLSVYLGETGRRTELPYGLWAEKSYGTLLMYIVKGEKEEEYWEQKISFLKEYELLLGKRGKCFVRFERLPREKISDLQWKKHCTKCFDYDRMDVMPIFRYPQEGDFLWLDSSGKTKRLSRLFIDEKVGKEERKKTVVLAEEHHILWVPALNRCSAYYYITDDTREVILANIY